MSETNIPAIRLMIHTLESSEYDQAYGRLAVVDGGNVSPPGFCCLGVESCELSRPGVVEELGINLYEYFWDGETWVSRTGDSNYSAIPGLIAQQIFGIRQHRVQGYLQNLNDGKHWPFPKIARFLRIAYQIKD